MSAKVAKADARFLWADGDIVFEDEPRAAEYHPEQARVPAGHPDGGQWTDGDSEHLTPIGEPSADYPYEDQKIINGRAHGEAFLKASLVDQEDSFDEAVWGIGGRSAWSAADAKRHVEQLIGAHLEQQFSADELEEMSTLLGVPTHKLGDNGKERETHARLAQNVASRITQQWAVSSGDTHPFSVLMQDAIRQEFGLDDAALDHIATPQDNAQAFRWRGDTTVAERAFSDLGIGKAFDDADTQRQRALIPRVLRAHARAQYTETQRELTEAGIEHLDLVRGVGLSRDSAFEIARTGTAALQPASSFSLDFDTARAFAGTGYTPGHTASTVIRTRVPRRRILSFPKTGFGCLNESEIVVLGGKIKTRIMYWLD